MNNIFLITILGMLVLNRSFFNLIYNIKMSIKFRIQNSKLENVFCKKCGEKLNIPKKRSIENYFFSPIIKRYYIEDFGCSKCNHKQKMIVKHLI